MQSVNLYNFQNLKYKLVSAESYHFYTNISVDPLYEQRLPDSVIFPPVKHTTAKMLQTNKIVWDLHEMFIRSFYEEIWTFEVEIKTLS